MSTDPAAGDPQRFLRSGRLQSMPRRWRDKLAVTRYLATQAMPVLLEPVGERELTDRLAALADDPVAVRRALVDQGLVKRTRDGAEYWRTVRTEYDPEVFLPDVDRIESAAEDAEAGRPDPE